MKFIQKALLLLFILAATSLVSAHSIAPKQTPINITDGGNLIYLDRHELDCGKGAMSYFRLMRENDGTKGTDRVQYNYSCINGAKIGQSSVHNTGFAGYNGKQSVNSLDQHNVKCPDGEVLQRFKLVRNKELNKVRYDFRCAKATTICCKSKKSNPDELGDKSFFHLDRQEAGVLDSQYWALSQFNLVTNNNKIHYAYRVCKLKDFQAEKELNILRQEKKEAEKNLNNLKNSFEKADKKLKNAEKVLKALIDEYKEFQKSFYKRKPHPFDKHIIESFNKHIKEARNLVETERSAVNALKTIMQKKQNILNTTNDALKRYEKHPGLTC